MPLKPNKLSIRYASLAGVFALICLVFIVVLAVIQIRGPQTDYYSFFLNDANTRTVTVAGLRGQIYDRNGVLLVGNSTSYDLLYEYGAMPDSFDEVNASLLKTLDAIDEAGEEDKLSDDLFPLDGFYPNVRYRAAIADTASNEYYHLQKVLERNGLDSDTTPEELAEYYIHRCKLSDDVYTQEEIRELMRLWYEMDRIGFGAYQPYTLAKNVSAELVTFIEEKSSSGIIEGVTFKTVSERYYNPSFAGYASHILGRVGKITAEDAEYYSELGYPMDCYVGISGCELAFEDILHGQDGKLVIKYDDDGNIIEKYYEKEPVSGNDVYLTIDIDLQVTAEDALAESISGIDTANTGALTAIDPNTGAVLAIASYPTFDLTKYSEKEYYKALTEDERLPLLNRALQGVYAPGSTYKIGVALASLEANDIDTSTTCICTGAYDALHHPACNGTHGITDIFTAIQESCNVFFYSIGHRMSTPPLTDYTYRLGLGTPTGIELGEQTGTVAGPEYREENKLDAWTQGDDLSAAIGQADHGYTPLQLSVYMSSIVNGGTRYSAHILDSVRHFYTKEPLHTHRTTALDTVSFSQSTYGILIDSMSRVISNNDEVKRYFKDLPVNAGGKTGTAEVNGQVDNALFCGFAPIEEPRIVVSCIIEEGLHGYYAAEPVAKVMEKYFEKYN